MNKNTNSAYGSDDTKKIKYPADTNWNLIKNISVSSKN